MRKVEPFTKTTDYISYRGDTFCGNALRATQGGEVVVLEPSSEMRFAVFRGEEAVISKSYTAADQDEEGFIGWGLLPEETADLEPSVYGVEIELRVDDLNVYTLLVGTLTIRADFIRPEVGPNA